MLKDTLKSITPLQWLGVIILFNTTILGSAQLLPDLGLGPNAVKAALALATIGNGFLGGLVTMFGGQSRMRDTLGTRGDVVFTNRANAEALPDNRNVIEMTPSLAVVAEKAGATPIVK